MSGVDTMIPIYNLREYSDSYAKNQDVCIIIAEMNQL